MKTEFINYIKKKGYLQDLKKGLSPKNKKILQDFMDYVAIYKKNEQALKGVERRVLQIYDVLEKPLSNITLKDVENLMRILNHSEDIKTLKKNELKGTLKRFLKRYYKDYPTRFNNFECIKKAKSETAKQDLLELEDVEKLIRRAETLRHKALLILIFETAGRPSEILNLKWKDISFENQEVTLTSRKNQDRKEILKRDIKIEKAIIHLERYKQEYPYTDVSDEDYLFPNKWDRTKAMLVSSVDSWLGNLSEKVLGKKITPYTLRHTTLNIWKSSKPHDKDYEYLADHSINVANKFYLQTDKKRRQTSQAEIYKALYNIEELTETEKDEMKKLKSRMVKMEKENLEVMKTICKMMNEIKGKKRYSVINVKTPTIKNLK